MNDKNCGTCCWRAIETQKGKFHDFRMPPTKSVADNVEWFCNNSESDKYMYDVSDPHGYCDAWEA